MGSILLFRYKCDPAWHQFMVVVFILLEAYKKGRRYIPVPTAYCCNYFSYLPLSGRSSIVDNRSWDISGNFFCIDVDDRVYIVHTDVIEISIGGPVLLYRARQL